MPGFTLTHARLEVLRPRKTYCDTRDPKLAAFSIRVLCTGRKHLLIHCQHGGVTLWGKPPSLIGVTG